MAQTQHAPSIANTALPYHPYGNITGDAPRFITGSYNILTSQKGYFERRPGFSPFEASPTTFTGTVKRIFSWRRWNASFYVMVNEVTATQSIVYKMELGVDNSFQSLFTSSSTEPFDFVVDSNHLFFGNGTDMKKWDGTTVTNWGITGPSVAPTMTTSGTGISATVGYYYVYCYENATTGGLSSPSPKSLSTGTFTNDQVNITVTPSTDTQVTGIRIFRSTDGGDGVYFEVQAAAFANTAGPHVDTTADTSLLTSTAPTGGFNDPPPRSKGFVWYANRIWMYVDNLVWFTGWEEIRNGFEAECVPSGGAGNYWAFDSEVTGLSVAEDGVIIFTGGKMFKIEGDTLDTFRRVDLAEGLGLRERATIARHGKVTAWLDSSSSIWITDSQQTQELSIPIRPDLENLVHSNCSMAFHVERDRRWLIFSKGFTESSLGPISGISAESSSLIGTAAWTNPNNILVEDGAFATRSLTVGTTSQLLLMKGFDVSPIPLNASIVGIFAEAKGNQTGVGAETRFHLVVNGGLFGGPVLANQLPVGVAAFVNTDESSRNSMFGSNFLGPLWNRSISRKDLDTIAIGAYFTRVGGGTNTTSVDFMRLTVYYRVPNLFVFDLDRNQWMPPWTIPATAIHSGETDEGKWNLLLLDSGTVRTLNDIFRDNETYYDASVVSNLFPMVAKMDSYAKLDHLGIERNQQPISDVLVLTDDDPEQVAHTSIIKGRADPPNRYKGTALQEDWFYEAGQAQPGKRLSFKIDFPQDNEHFKVYSLDVAVQKLGM